MFTTGFTIAICDDDPLYLEHSEQIISEFLLTQTEIEKYTILTFSSGEELWKKISSSTITIDILFLDIEMPGMSGIVIKNRLQNSAQIRYIIFVSSHTDLMIGAFGMKVIGFLIKPVERTQYYHWLRYVISKRGSCLKLSLLDTKNSSSININDIVYIEGNKDYISMYMYTCMRPLILETTMKKIERTFVKYPFVRIHKSYIVNMSFINSVHGCKLHLSNSDTILPIGRTYKNYFKQHFDEFLINDIRNRT